MLHVASARLAGGEGIPLVIGEECTVGHGVILHACTVGRRCLVGMGAIVMDGAVIGDEVIIGAGALVPAGKQLPPRTLWIGSPARQQRALDARGNRLPRGIRGALRQPEERLPAGAYRFAKGRGLLRFTAGRALPSPVFVSGRTPCHSR